MAETLLSPKASLAVIISVEQPPKILLTKRHQPEKPTHHGKWHLPGGTIEELEAPEATLKREIHEELGWSTLQVVRYISVTQEKSPSSDTLQLFHLFLVTASTTLPINISNDLESSEARWFEVSEVTKLATFPLVTQALAAFDL